MAAGINVVTVNAEDKVQQSQYAAWCTAINTIRRYQGYSDEASTVSSNADAKSLNMKNLETWIHNVRALPRIARTYSSNITLPNIEVDNRITAATATLINSTLSQYAAICNVDSINSTNSTQSTRGTCSTNNTNNSGNGTCGTDSTIISDPNVKKNIHKIDYDALSKLKEISFYQYDYIDSSKLPSNIRSSHVDIGTLTTELPNELIKLKDAYRSYDVIDINAYLNFIARAVQQLNEKVENIIAPNCLQSTNDVTRKIINEDEFYNILNNLRNGSNLYNNKMKKEHNLEDPGEGLMWVQDG